MVLVKQHNILFHLCHTHLRVQRQRTARPVDHNHIQIARLQQLVLHLGYPIRQRRIDEPMNDELCRACRTEIRSLDALAIVGPYQLALLAILHRVQNEAGVDDVARERKDVEGPVDEMVPVARDVQAADVAEAARLVLV